MKRNFPGLIFFVGIIFFFAFAVRTPDELFQNTSPTVRIISPAPHSVHDINAPIRYRISVSDKEDGDSRYQEIAVNEVYLEIIYGHDESQVKKFAEQKKSKTIHLDRIKNAGCFTCHALRSQVIGPSFEAVSKRYYGKEEDIKMLPTSIINGSTGTWGEQIMPAHPHISKEQAMRMVEWIVQESSEERFNMQAGIEGSLMLLPPPSLKKGVALLIASYIDHGTKDNPQSRLKGVDEVIIEFQIK